MPVLNFFTKEQIEAEENRKKDEETIASLQNYLDNTDWYVTRKQETGKEIPEEILTARREARDRISLLRG